MKALKKVWFVALLCVLACGIFVACSDDDDATVNFSAEFVSGDGAFSGETTITNGDDSDKGTKFLFTPTQDGKWSLKMVQTDEDLIAAGISYVETANGTWTDADGGEDKYVSEAPRCVYLKNCDWETTKIYYYQGSDDDKKENATWADIPEMVIEKGDTLPSCSMEENWVTPGTTMIVFYCDAENRYPADSQDGVILQANKTGPKISTFDLSTKEWILPTITHTLTLSKVQDMEGDADPVISGGVMKANIDPKVSQKKIDIEVVGGKISEISMHEIIAWVQDASGVSK